MIDPKTVTKEQLKDENVVRELRKDIDRVVRQKKAKEALAYAGLIDRMGDDLQEGIRELEGNVIVTALPLLSSERVEQALAGDLRVMLQAGLRRRFRDRLLSLPPSARDKVKSALLSVLETNGTELTAGGFGTVQEWVKHFSASKRRPEDYLRSSTEAKSLDAEDVERLRRLLSMVYDIASSSLTNEGLEDEIVVRDKSGSYKVWSKGEMTAFVGDEQPAAVPPPAAPPVTPPSPPSPPPAPKAPAPGLHAKANFFFHTEDDDEIREHAKRLEGIAGSTPAVAGDAVVSQVAQTLGLTFVDEAMRSRFRSVAQSFLKDVRSRIDTIGMLASGPTEGGLGYDKDRAVAVVDALEQAMKNPPGATPEPLPAPVPEPNEPGPETRPARTRPAVPPPPVVSTRTAPLSQEQGSAAVREAIKQAKQQETVVVPTRTIPEDRPKPPPIRRASVSIDAVRPPIEDIKRAKRTTGPIDELKTMTLMDFQRLGRSTQESVGKIREKLDILEEENFSKRLEGIAAWRSSPLFRQYLTVGRRSMTEEKAYEDIIEAMRSGGEDTIDEDEFQAIADLNKSLRF